MRGKTFIAHDELPEALERLSKSMDVWIPTAINEEKCEIQFLPYQSDRLPVLDRQSTMPVKKVIFPQVETLLNFSRKKDENNPFKSHIELEDEEEVSPVLVFGARPCDVRGFLVFDEVYLNGPYKDPYYAKRREKTLFATLVCETSDNACFCSAVGSGPADRTGSDLWIIPVNGGYVIEALTERGEDLMPVMGKDATEAQIAEAQDVQEKVAALRIGEADLTQNSDDFEDRFSDNEYWRDMAFKCISCGICTYVCPTCYCFNITDEAKGLDGERIRSWDSCMFNHFTREASGHNPRPSKLERYRNRIGHKFSYFPKKYKGMIACCGCGRCIRRCPVALDIRNVVLSLKKNKENVDVCK